ncbi:MAG: hypothetical protein AAF236_16720, partial [Verrucomicrobiota bacterium]
MLPEVETLVRIQHHDQKVRAIDKEIASIPIEADDIRARLESDQAAVAAARDEVQKVEVAIKSLELDVQTRRDSIAKLKVQQFETRKNDEFRAIGEEIERYGVEISELEDSELELMEEVDAKKQSLGEAEAALGEAETSVAEELADLDKLGENLRQDKEGHLDKRTGLSKKLDEVLLDTYERIFSGKNGVAVVPLTDE